MKEFEKVLKQYERLIYKAMISVNPYDKEERENALHYATMELWRCWKTFDEKRGIKFITFAYNNIMRTTMTKVLRDREKKRRKCDNEISLNNPISSDTTNSIECELPSKVNVTNEVVEKMMFNEIMKEMEKELKPKHYRILELYTQGFNFSEISKSVGISYAYTLRLFYKIVAMIKIKYNVPLNDHDKKYYKKGVK